MRRLDYLLTNDDGIEAPGMAALVAAFRGRARCLVAAPAAPRSAVGHSITIHKPITCDPVRLPGGARAYAVGGTPADAVKLALRELAPRPPRFVLSGINFGANLGLNVFYSGTVAAAMEGAFAGIPSFAISLATKVEPRWTDATRVARRVVEEFLPFVEGSPLCLNVNIPNLPERRLKGVRFTHQARSPYQDSFHRRRDPRGRTYYWMDGDRVLARRNGHPPPAEMTDVEAVRRGFVSITPLRLSLTCESTFHRLAGAARARRER
jgi:5'-nucleotidase